MSGNQTSSFRTQRGYSLAEVLVAVAIFALIFVAALAVYDQSNRVFKRGVEAAETQQNVRVAFDKLVADLRMSGYDYDRDGIPTGAAGTTWAPTRTYGIGNNVVPPVANGFLYRMQLVVGGGTSCTSSAGPVAWPVTVGNTVNDGNCQWVTLAGINQYQQPDEQIEFAHPSAITVRANFDYELNQPGDRENGREPSLESPQFPVITTANDEIVTYALRSVSGTNNTSDILFYADVVGGRRAFPGVGGQPEDQVRIPNVNLGVTTGVGCSATAPCFPDAPYTLFRFSLQPNGAVNETPLASNIRSLRFQYYPNVTGVDPATVPTGWVAGNQLADAGGGQYNPANPGAAIALAPRIARSQIRSVRVTITGMSEGTEPNYQNPLEPASSNVRNYHTYRLESLIVPRNLGKQGMREIPPSPPGAPILQDALYGYCGIVVVSWLAPVNQPGQGQVESYVVQWNTTGSNTVFPFLKDVGPNTTGTITGLDPNQAYTFTVAAVNSFGSQIAVVPGSSPAQTATVGPIMPKNNTKPGSPNGGIAAGTAGSAFATGGGLANSPAAQVNQIIVSWEPPLTNVVGLSNGFRKPAGGGGAVSVPIDPIYGEITRYKVFRDTTSTFTPTTGVGGNEISTTAPNILTVALGQVTFTDKSALNCVTYYYKVLGVENCEDNTTCATCNTGGANGYTPFYPASGAPGIPGRADANQKPAKPTALMDLPTSSCNASLNKCDFHLRWTKVKTDDQTPANALVIKDYDVIREQWDTGNVTTTPDAVVTIPWPDTTPAANPYIDFQDLNVDSRNLSGPITYKYHVVAKQCPLTPGPGYQFTSDPSNIVTLPCTPLTTPPTVIVTDIMGGTGTSAATAWLTNNPLSKVEVTGAGLSTVQVFLEGQGRIIDLGLPTTTGTAPAAITYSFPLSQTDVGSLYSIFVLAKDTAGCQIMMPVYYVEEATATGCCLANFDNDPSVVSYTPGLNFVEITFKNLCSNRLNVQPNGVILDWDPAIANNSTGAAVTLTTVEFPSTSTGSATLTVNQTAGVGVTTPGTAIQTRTLSPPTAGSPPALITVAANSDTYVIRVNFDRTLANASSPITRACVLYQRPGIDTSNQSCKIIPLPAITPFTCN